MGLSENMREQADSSRSTGLCSCLMRGIRNAFHTITAGHSKETIPEMPECIERNVDGFAVTLRPASFHGKIEGLCGEDVSAFCIEKVIRREGSTTEEIPAQDAFGKMIIILPREIMNPARAQDQWSSDPVDIVVYSKLRKPADREIAKMISRLKNGTTRQLSTLEFPDGNTLLVQGQETDAAYVLVSGNVEVLVKAPGGQTLSLRTASAPTLLGEISAIRGGPATASVRTKGSCTVIRVPKDALRELAKCNQYQPYFEKLVNERLAQITMALDAYAEREERARAQRTETGFFMEERTAVALDLPSAIEEIDERIRPGERYPVVRRTMTLLGQHRDTKERKSVEFHIAIARNYENKIMIHISLHPNAIPESGTGRGPGIECEIDDDLREAFLSEGYMKELQGFSFYSQILSTMLRQIPVTKSGIRERHTRAFLEDQPEGEIVTPSLLCLHSPVAAARKHGLSVMRGTPRNAPSVTLETYKVPPSWQWVLILTLTLERLLVAEDYASARARIVDEYGYDPLEIAESLRVHAQEEDEKLMSSHANADFRKAAQLQLERLRALPELIAQKEELL